MWWLVVAFGLVAVAAGIAGAYRLNAELQHVVRERDAFAARLYAQQAVEEKCMCFGCKNAATQRFRFCIDCQRVAFGGRNAKALGIGASPHSRGDGGSR